MIAAHLRDRAGVERRVRRRGVIHAQRRGRGNDATIAFALARGSFELNTYLPVIARNLLESIELLAAAVTLLDTRCVAGIEADEDQCRAYAESSPAVATALNPLLGYEVVAGLVKASRESGRSVSALALEGGLASASELAALLDVVALTLPEG